MVPYMEKTTVYLDGTVYRQLKLIARHQGRNRCVCVKMHAPGVTPTFASAENRAVRASEGLIRR